ncbi:MAG: lysylphosphatidylglycerol synthase domain-containing protein [Chloroflexaceae bacterium]|jgi:hypothetical protein|nr:lysylphosphatidylglycerol synthase domain-containing protein [Chloroflexaceae bacterium]
MVSSVVLVAWAAFLYNQLETLQQYAWVIAPSQMVLGVLWGTIYFGGLALCWAFLVHQGATSVSSSLLFTTLQVWLLSMFTRYIPGNVWHILSRAALASRLNMSAAQVVSSATIEQLLTLLGALTLVGITLPFWTIAAGNHIWLLALLPVGLLFLHPQMMGRGLAWVALRLRRPELAWHYTYRNVLTILLAYTVATLCSGLSLYFVLAGMTTVQLWHLPTVVGVAALAWAGGYLSFFTPSGLGVREAILTLLLTQLYPLPVAVTASLLFRIALTVGELLAVLIAWLSNLFVKGAHRDNSQE